MPSFNDNNNCDDDDDDKTNKTRRRSFSLKMVLIGFVQKKKTVIAKKRTQLIKAIFRVWITQNARATSHAKFQQKEKFFAGEKSSIPTKFFWYTKMTPVNLRGLQI